MKGTGCLYKLFVCLFFHAMAFVFSFSIKHLTIRTGSWRRLVNLDLGLLSLNEKCVCCVQWNTKHFVRVAETCAHTV